MPVPSAGLIGSRTRARFRVWSLSPSIETWKQPLQTRLDRETGTKELAAREPPISFEKRGWQRAYLLFFQEPSSQLTPTHS
jgi:hypothetical protein